VVEYTAGTTGVSLAFVCAARGYPIEIVFSDAFSDEKRRMMKAYGARVTDVPGDRRTHQSGGNVAAAIRVAAGDGTVGTVVTIIVDSGLRYLSTDVHADPDPIPGISA